MKLGTWFSIHAVCALLFAAMLLLSPQSLLAAYGLTTDAVGVATARQLGATFLAFGVIAWLARSAPPGPALRSIVVGFAVALPVGCVCSLHAQLTVAPNPLHWSVVCTWGVLAAGYWWCLLAGKSGSPAADPPR